MKDVILSNLELLVQLTLAMTYNNQPLSQVPPSLQHVFVESPTIPIITGIYGM